MVAETPLETHISDIPLLPLRDVVVYPHMVTPLFVGRGKSIEALERAMAADKQVLLVAQKIRNKMILRRVTCMKLAQSLQFCSC